MKVALRLEGLRKSYGRVRALDGLDLEVPAGATTGLVGPNGAGKTTAFAVVAGLVRPDGGRVDVLGAGPYRPERMGERLALLPQDAELPPHVPVGRWLAWMARLQGLGRRAARREAERVLELLGLADRAASRTRQLSHGMRRRVALAQALLGEPELVLLDEPVSGLDPDLLVQVREVLRGLRGRCTLLISSHQLAELEATCDHVVFIEHGRRVRQGTMQAVTGRQDTLRIRLRGEPDLAVLRASLPAASLEFADEELVVRIRPDDDPAALNRALLPALLAQGVDVLEVHLGHGLEDAWLRHRRGTGEA